MAGRPPAQVTYGLRPVDFDPEKTNILESETRLVRFTRGRAHKTQKVIRGVPKEYWEYIKAAAHKQGMTMNVYISVIAEAARDKRLLILPSGYTLDTLLEERFRELVRLETEKVVKRVLGEQTPVDPYIR